LGWSHVSSTDGTGTDGASPLKRERLILAAWLADQLAGDPEWFPHPVRLIGLSISRGEKALRRSSQDPLTELVLGAALTGAIVTGSYYATRTCIRIAARRSPVLGDAVELLLAWTCLAARNLEQEAAAVVRALDANDIGLARQRLARIVGRDTHALDEPEICRAVIETLAESTSDGILAPLFYMTLGGVPLAMAYKAVNTLDSMIGHADARYFYFGKAAARLDDAANYLPARLTAGAVVASAAIASEADPEAAWKTWRRDGDKHKSPNAGQPESAIAGALRVRLGGRNTYAGEVIAAPIMGAEFAPPSRAQARRAIRIVSTVTVLGAVCGMAFAALARSKEAR